MKKSSIKNDIPFADDNIGDYLYNNIIKDVNDMKSVIVRDVMNNNHHEIQNDIKFLSKINDFIKFWYNYGVQTMSRIQENGFKNNHDRDVKYSTVKPFIFGKYDFKSVLLYTDGVCRLTADKSDKYTQGDLKSFFKFTIEKAFQNEKTEVNDLISTTLSSIDLAVPEDNASEFDPNIIKEYDLFPESDYTDLYKSVEGVMNFITANKMKKLFDIKKKINNKLLIGFVIKSIFDYMIYSLSFYALRIYVVSKFLNSYINDNEDDGEVVEESAYSTIENEFFKLNIAQDKENEYHSYHKDFNNAQIFRIMDETIFRNPNSTAFFKEFERFLDYNGIKVESDKFITVDKIHDLFKDIFADSKLYKYLTDEKALCTYEAMDNIDEIYLHLKYIFNNTKLGLEIDSNKAIFLNTLIHSEYDGKETISDFKKSSERIYYFAKYFFRRIRQLINAVNGLWNQSMNCDHLKNPMGYIGYKKKLAECADFLNKFYDEFALFIWQTMTDIERNIFDINEKKRKEALAQSAIDFDEKDIEIKMNRRFSDSINKEDIGYDDTSEIEDLKESIDTYSSFENIMIYKEYFKNIPELEGFNYFTEETWGDKIKGWWDQFINWLKGIFKPILDWFSGNNVAFEKAAKWVREKDDEFRGARWKDDTIIENVHIFKDSIDFAALKEVINNISLSKENIASEQNFENHLKDIIGKIAASRSNTFPSDMYDVMMKKDKTKVKNFIPYYVFYDWATLMSGTVESPNSKNPFQDSKIGVSDDITVDWLKENCNKSIKGESHIKELVRKYTNNFSETNTNTCHKILSELNKALTTKIDDFKKLLQIDEKGSEITGTNNKMMERVMVESNSIFLFEEEEAKTEEKKDEKKEEESTKIQVKNNETITKINNAFLSISVCIIQPLVSFSVTYYTRMYKFLQEAYKKRSDESMT